MIKNSHILLVEDDSSLLELIEKLLVKNNYIVSKSSTISEATEKIKFYIFDLILLDVMLPDSNGLDFYIGSNGNLIQVKKNRIDLPYLFGDIEIIEFLKLKKIIDNSKFDYKNVKNLYYFKSKRWDIETKDDLIIKLPFEKLEKSFEILLKLFDNKEFNSLKVIDLRQKNLIISNE